MGESGSKEITILCECEYFVVRKNFHFAAKRLIALITNYQVLTTQNLSEAKILCGMGESNSRHLIGNQMFCH